MFDYDAKLPFKDSEIPTLAQRTPNGYRYCFKRMYHYISDAEGHLHIYPTNKLHLVLHIDGSTLGPAVTIYYYKWGLISKITGKGQSSIERLISNASLDITNVIQDVLQDIKRVITNELDTINTQVKEALIYAKSKGES